MRATLPALAVLSCLVFVTAAHGDKPLCEGHGCQTNWTLRAPPNMQAFVFAQAGDNPEMAIAAVRSEEANYIGAVCARSGSTITFRVSASDDDDHMCQGVVTGKVANFIQNTDLSVQITGTGIAATVPLVSAQAGDVSMRTWRGA